MNTPPLTGTLVAGLSLAAAVLLRWLLDPVMGDSLPLVTLFGAVATSVWWGGYVRAAVVSLFGYLACAYLFIEPRGVVGLGTTNLVGFAAYAFTCTLLIWLGELARAGNRRAELGREALRTTLASIGDGVIATDTDGRVTSLNSVAESLTGWSSAEAVGRPLEAVFRIVNEESRAPVDNPVDTVFRQGRIVGLANHTVLISRDGRERPIDDSAAPIKTSDGEIVGAVLIFRDVTERRREEQALRRSERDLQQIYDTTPLGMCLIDREMRYVRINDRLAEMNGVPAAAHIGRTIGEVVPALVAEAEPAFRRVIDTGEAVANIEISGETAAQPGVQRTWLESWYPQRDEHGAVVGVNVIAEEITHRKRAEAQLRESEIQFRTLGEAVPDFLWMADAEGRPMYQNPAWREYVGWTHVELSLRGWEDLFHPDDRPGMKERWTDALARAVAFQVEARMRRYDGAYRWFASRTVPLKDEAGRLIKWVGTMTDIHDLKLAEAALREADRRKDEFLALLAHELRNPLAPISNAVQILRLNPTDPQTVRAASEMLDRQVSQMSRLVDDLLDVNRITRGKIELRKERVELGAILKQAIDAARPVLQRMDHELTLTVPAEPIVLDADPARLTQAVGNLLNNASKFMDRGGRIGLTVERVNDQVAIRVRDGGIGIAPDQLPRIFDMFMQVDTSLERSVSGLGIGLSLVKTMTELHGGTVDVYSDGLGQGSEFVIRLPIFVSNPLPFDSILGRTGPPNGRRVLVVDDNQDGAESLAALLALSGHDTQIATDGLEAVEVAERFQPEVVLLDIGLPRLNGYDACRRIREQPWGKDMLLVAVTGWGQDDDRRLSREAGFDRHLVKPVDPDELVKMLQVQRTGPERSGQVRTGPEGTAEITTGSDGSEVFQGGPKP